MIIAAVALVWEALKTYREAKQVPVKIGSES